MRHRIRLRALNKETPPNPEVKAMLRRCVNAAIRLCDIDVIYKKACKVDVLYTDDEGISLINESTRGIPSPTDVLSFPFFDIAGGERLVPDPDTGLCHLGDIVISLERAKKQAVEYGHSFEREVGYLVVHGTLHLLGFDHESPDEKAEMRRFEEEVMSFMSMRR